MRRPACWRRLPPPSNAPGICAPRAGPPMLRSITAKAAGDEARARLNRAERSVELTNNSLSYATLEADTRGVVTATLIEPGQVVASGQTAIRVARFREKEAVVAIPETLLGRAKRGVATVTPVVGAEQEIRSKAARGRARGRSRDAHLSRKILAARRGRRRLARHDRDPDAGRSRDRSAWRGCRCRRCSAKAAIPRSTSSMPPAKSR